MVLGIMFVVLAAGVAVATPFMIRYLEARQTGGSVGQTSAPKLRSKKGESVSFRDLWPVREIRDGIIYLPDGYRIVLSLGSVDYNLMSESAQMSVVSALIGVVMSLNDDVPVQVFGTAQGVDTAAYTGEIYAYLQAGSGNLAEYGRALASCLDAFTINRQVQIYRRYLVLTSAERDLEVAVRELRRTSGVISATLNSAGISVKSLTTEEILDLLGHVFNRGDLAQPSDLVRAGGLYFWKEGVVEDVAV